MASNWFNQALQTAVGVKDTVNQLTTQNDETTNFEPDRWSVREITRKLNDFHLDVKIDGMKQVLAGVSSGQDGDDVKKLFPHVVKNVSTESLELKKLVYIYLVLYSESNREMALMSVNIIQKDLSDRSQIVRAAALRAMASIKVLEIIEIAMMAIRKAVPDMSPYLRKTAASVMCRVYDQDPDQGPELTKMLIQLMQDQELVVCGTAVMSFHYITVLKPMKVLLNDDHDEPIYKERDVVLQENLQLLHPLFRKLVAYLVQMECWAQIVTVDLLLRYCKAFFKDPNTALPAGIERDELSRDYVNFLQALHYLTASMNEAVVFNASLALFYLAPREDLSKIIFPLVRCLTINKGNVQQLMLQQAMPVIESLADEFKPYYKEFFVFQQLDNDVVKNYKLTILGKLCDEDNVYAILKEFEQYVRWHSYPKFVQSAVKQITKIALKIDAVTDSCLKGLLRMLDSKSQNLASEAVIAVRAILQQKSTNTEDALQGKVIGHLVRSLKELQAPAARASVIWIISQYQDKVPCLVPDTLRLLAANYQNEGVDVKLQILIFAIKVWGFHLKNSKQPDTDMPMGEGYQWTFMPPQVSRKLIPRLTKLVDYLLELAEFDVDWDVRDMGRCFKAIRVSAEKQDGTSAFGKFAEKYVGSENLKLQSASKENEVNEENHENIYQGWTLGSLAYAMGYPLESYSKLPDWPENAVPDEVREVAEQQQPIVRKKEVQSISSSQQKMNGLEAHMASRAFRPSNIAPAPKAPETLEDLDLFYSDQPEMNENLNANLGNKNNDIMMPGIVKQDSKKKATVDLFDFGMAGAGGKVTAGEDDESDEGMGGVPFGANEDSESDDGFDPTSALQANQNQQQTFSMNQMANSLPTSTDPSPQPTPKLVSDSQGGFSPKSRTSSPGRMNNVGM